MQRVHSVGLVIVAVAQTFALHSFIGSDGVPYRGPIHALTGYFYGPEGFIPVESHKINIRRAVEDKDYEEFKRRFTATDLLDCPDILVRAIVANDSTLLEIIDEKTNKQLNFKKTYDATRYPDSEHIILQAITNKSDKALEFLVNHGFEDDVTTVVNHIGDNCYGIALRSMNMPITKVCMGPQYKKDPSKIDRDAQIAIGFVQAHCSSNKKDTIRCQAARNYFTMYVQELQRYQALDDYKLAIAMTKDASQAVALEEFLSILIKRNVVIDKIFDEQGNNLIQIAIMHDNKMGMETAVRAMNPELYSQHVNTEGKAAGDIVLDKLRICQKHSDDPVQERRYRKKCHDARALSDLYEAVLKDHAKMLMLRKQQQEEREFKDQQKKFEEEKRLLGLQISAEKQQIILDAQKYVEDRNKEVIRKEEELLKFQKEQQEIFAKKEGNRAQKEKEFKELWDSDDTTKK